MYTVRMPYWKIDRLIYCKKKKKKKINGYSKGISLGNIYKNFLWKKKKIIKLFWQLFIFLIKMVLKFS